MTLGIKARVDNFLRKPYAMAYIFIFPAFFLLVVFHILPFFASFFISLLNMQVSFRTARFVGLENFRLALQDRFFRNALSVTMKFVIVEVPLQMLVGLLFAALVTKNSFFNKLMRSIYFLPIVVSATAMGIMWGMTLHQIVGIFTYWINLMGFGRIAFLNTQGLAFGTVVFVVLWRSFGVSILILVAAMQAVPDDYYDAAEVDGAGKIRQFWSITIPSIMPAIWFLVMTRVIGALQIFEIIFTLTGGGPNFTTETVVAYVYRKINDGTSHMGYGTAMCLYLFAFIMTVTVIQYIIMKRTEQ